MTQKIAAGKTVNLPFPHRTLIVDDDPSVLFAYRKLLEREGLGMDVCESLGEAVKQVRKAAYLAVIVDLRLAGADNGEGLEFLRIIGQESGPAKVILVSAYGTDELGRTAGASGAAYYFEKPVAPSAILDLLVSLESALSSTS